MEKEVAVNTYRSKGKEITEKIILRPTRSGKNIYIEIVNESELKCTTITIQEAQEFIDALKELKKEILPNNL